MNQILYTGGKKGKGGTTDLQKIIIIFAVIIIIFAICLIAGGINLFKKIKEEKPTVPNGTGNNPGQSNVTNTTPDIPEEPEEPTESKIEIGFASELGGVKVMITSSQKIEKIAYWWDEEEPTVIETDEKEYETVIPSKQGTHTLNIEVTDEKGETEDASQLVIGDSEPELEIATDGISNYVIKAKDDQEITKLVIILNGETKEVEVNEKEIEYKVPIPQGYSLIDVTVYNINDISVNKKAKISNFGG